MSVPGRKLPTVEAHRRASQDLEWAHAGGRRFLLQARSITALPRPPRLESRPRACPSSRYRNA